jgi:hypothetical protein
MYVHQNFTADKLAAAGLRVLRSNTDSSPISPARYDIVDKDERVIFVVTACGDTFSVSNDLHNEFVKSLVSFTTVMDSVTGPEYNLKSVEVHEEGWDIVVDIDSICTIVKMKHAAGYVSAAATRAAFRAFLDRNKKKA